MRLDEYARHDATDLAALVRSGEVDPAELAACAAAAAEAVDPTLNALVGPIDENAPWTSDAPFSGVPVLSKSGHGRAGGPLGAGTRLLAGRTVPVDDVFSARIRASGVAFVGATTAPEFGLYAVTESRLHGATRNPWDPSRSPGGSSGGASAAVAAGIVPVATSGDGGGSIRTPAHCTGVFGLKPSRGRTPFEANHFFNLSVNHVTTRTVRDSAAFLDVTQGAHPGARSLIPPPSRPFSAEVDREPGRLRIGFATELAGFATAGPDSADAVGRTAALLADLGHDVAEASPGVGWAGFFDAFLRAWTHALPWSVGRLERLLGRPAEPEELEVMTWRYRRHGETVTVADLLDADQAFRAASRAVDDYFDAFDLWLTPTAVTPAPRIGDFDPSDTDETAAEYSYRVLRDYSAFTPLLNVTGHPAASVPARHGAGGLPIGVQLVGRAAGEAELLRVCAQLETANPWQQRTPPIWAGSAAGGGAS
ncbi:MAG: amidase [Microbacterium sp.]|jgi:amidase|uniref:amidase n=1 Tax=Microbacterium sp. TaxID=51671 RepID=UPI002822650F|nr:amidase [Microbacterium sp.]MDR2322831.1 amidase [Microbacterium sp.]